MSDILYLLYKTLSYIKEANERKLSTAETKLHCPLAAGGVITERHKQQQTVQEDGGVKQNEC